MKIEAVLFDLDGTLIDSMDLHYLCWCEVLTLKGKVVSKIDFLRSEGSNIHKLMSDLTGCEDDTSLTGLIRIKDELFASKYRFNLYPGVRELINFLTQLGIRMGIVTASSRERFNKTIPPEFIGYFDCVVTGSDLSVGKPSPEVYLEGARRLGLDSEKILVIENAPLGVMSALGAGMRCMVVGNTLPRQDFPDSVEYFETNLELLWEVKSEFKKGGHNYGETRSGS